MGSSQSTNSSRAAKFSGNGNRRSMRAVRSAPATDPTMRRTTSVRNTNRNVKEFSKFWSDAGSVTRSKSSTRASTKRSNNNSGGVRRSRTQSVDVRRSSNSLLPVPSTNAGSSPKNSIKRDRSSSQKQSSFRKQQRQQQNPASSSQISTKQKSSSNTARSEVYSDEFNQAAIAAARLKRLSLTPHQDFGSRCPSPHQTPKKPHFNNRGYQNSPETAIY